MRVKGNRTHVHQNWMKISFLKHVHVSAPLGPQKFSLTWENVQMKMYGGGAWGAFSARHIVPCTRGERAIGRTAEWKVLLPPAFA